MKSLSIELPTPSASGPATLLTHCALQVNLPSISGGGICLPAGVFWLQSSSSEPKNDSLALVF